MINKSLLLNELYLMDKGIRDCFEVLVSGDDESISKDIEYIIEKATEYHFMYFMVELEADDDDPCNTKYVSMFIFKYNYQKILLSVIYNKFKAHSFEYEYCLGTLLGYSGESMEEFLMKDLADKIVEDSKNEITTKPNFEFCKNYYWVNTCREEDSGILVYVRFDPYDYEEKLGIKHDHWVDENGFDNSLDYFKVDKVSVTIYNDDSILIESEKEEDVNKVLEYIDKVVAS